MNIKRLTSFLANKYRDQISLHESDPNTHPYPKTLPTLSMSYYPRLVGDCSGEVNLLPSFQNALSKEQNLHPWRVCGAAPLTCATLLNPSVRQVPETNDAIEDSEVVVVGNVVDFDWKYATLLDLENENKAAIDKLA